MSQAFSLLLTGGHYTAYCLNYLNDQWYEFDDQYVTEVDVGQVINCEAYVLFYRYIYYITLCNFVFNVQDVSLLLYILQPYLNPGTCIYK